MFVENIREVKGEGEEIMSLGRKGRGGEGVVKRKREISDRENR